MCEVPQTHMSQSAIAHRIWWFCLLFLLVSPSFSSNLCPVSSDTAFAASGFYLYPLEIYYNHSAFIQHHVSSTLCTSMDTKTEAEKHNPGSTLESLDHNINHKSSRYSCPTKFFDALCPITPIAVNLMTNRSGSNNASLQPADYFCALSEFSQDPQEAINVVVNGGSFTAGVMGAGASVSSAGLVLVSANLC